MANLLAQGVNPECEWDNTDVHNNIDWKMVVDSSMSIQQRISGGSWIQRQEWTQDTLTIQNSSGCTLELQDGSSNGYQLTYDTSSGSLNMAGLTSSNDTVSIQNSSGCTLELQDGASPSNGYQLVYDTTNGLLVRSVVSGTADTLATFTSTQATFAKKVVMEAGLDVEVGSSSVLEVTSSKVLCKEELEMASGKDITSPSGSALVLDSGKDLVLKSTSTGLVDIDALGGLDVVSGANSLFQSLYDHRVYINSAITGSGSFEVHNGTPASGNQAFEVDQDSVVKVFAPLSGVATIKADAAYDTQSAKVEVGDARALNSLRGILELHRHHTTTTDMAGVLVFRAEDGQQLCLSVWSFVDASTTKYQLWLTKGSPPTARPTAGNDARELGDPVW